MGPRDGPCVPPGPPPACRTPSLTAPTPGSLSPPPCPVPRVAPCPPRPPTSRLCPSSGGSIPGRGVLGMGVTPSPPPPLTGDGGHPPTWGPPGRDPQHKRARAVHTRGAAHACGCTPRTRAGTAHKRVRCPSRVCKRVAGLIRVRGGGARVQTPPRPWGAVTPGEGGVQKSVLVQGRCVHVLHTRVQACTGAGGAAEPLAPRWADPPPPRGLYPPPLGGDNAGGDRREGN